jgi:chromosome partitioning protein
MPARHEQECLSSLAINSGVMPMLEWFKRIAAPAPREELIKPNDQTPPSKEQVERLIGRLGTDAGAPHAPTSGLTHMCVIVVASQKGGVGKTTIAAHLAVRAGIVGQGPAVLVDTDPQGSLTEWWKARNDEPAHDTGEQACNASVPALEAVKLDDLAAKLQELRSNGTAVAIIDTPPALTGSIERAIGMADLVLIPARPSPHDLRAIGATVNLTRRAGKQFLFVINGAAPRANITAEAVAALSEHGRVAPTILYQRTDYAASMIDGRTVMETATSGRSTQEIAELWKHVYGHITMRAAA